MEEVAAIGTFNNILDLPHQRTTDGNVETKGEKPLPVILLLVIRVTSEKLAVKKPINIGPTAVVVVGIAA